MKLLDAKGGVVAVANEEHRGNVITGTFREVPAGSTVVAVEFLDGRRITETMGLPLNTNGGDIVVTDRR